MKKLNLNVRYYLLDVIRAQEYYNKKTIEDAIKDCGYDKSCGYSAFLTGLLIDIHFYNEDCLNFLIECGYKKPSVDMYWEVITRELKNIVSNNLIK